MIRKLLLKGFREGAGRLMALGSFVSLPKPIQRTQLAQQKVDEACERLKLYQFYACPFCIKVRRNIHRLGLNIETVDAQSTAQREKLKALGGQDKVPCLRIEQDEKIIWLYESDTIIFYLEQAFQNNN